MSVSIRLATTDDATAMSRLLGEILRARGSDRPYDPGHITQHYIAHPHRLACTVATDPNGALLGFQSLKRAWPGNPYDVTPGWGIIGTYVASSAGGQGVGRALFATTRDATSRAGLLAIDATIGTDNVEGLAYYEAVGFRTYRTVGVATCKRYIFPRKGQE